MEKLKIGHLPINLIFSLPHVKYFKKVSKSFSNDVFVEFITPNIFLNRSDLVIV